MNYSSEARCVNVARKFFITSTVSEFYFLLRPISRESFFPSHFQPLFAFIFMNWTTRNFGKRYVKLSRSLTDVNLKSYIQMLYNISFKKKFFPDLTTVIMSFFR